MADILYVIRHVPSSDAPTLRCASVIRVLRNCGLSVDLMTTFAAPVDVVSSGLSLGEDHFFFPCELSASQKVSRFFEMALGIRASMWIARYIEEHRPKVVLFYGGTSTLVARVYKHAKQYNVRVIVDETDWFEPRSDMNAYSRVYYTLDNRRLRHVDAGLDGIIAISPFFYDYFSRTNSNVLFFPPCVESLPSYHISQHHYNRRSVSFVYAGSLGPDKDILLPFARALISYRANDNIDSITVDNPRFLLKVVGVKAEDMACKLSISPKELASLGIECFGRLPHDKTLSIVKSCDFGLLLRHPLLYARAGFSTKAVEYLANGLPLICNSVGGVDTFIDSGVDGFVLGPRETDEKSLLTLIAKIATLDNDALVCMSAAARAKASNLFVEDRYQGPFRSFFDAVLA